ncbi:MAG: hypothetical protein ACYC69_02940 [Thermodesulfovibrionales bacterium]
MDELKKCPFCGESILAEAKKCKHCGEWLDESARTTISESKETQGARAVADGILLANKRSVKGSCALLMPFLSFIFFFMAAEGWQPRFSKVLFVMLGLFFAFLSFKFLRKENPTKKRP